MNQASSRKRPFLMALSLPAAVVLMPCQSWAYGGGALPWDYPLGVMQTFVTGSLAHFVIMVSAVAALLGYALDSDGEFTRRCVRAVIGTTVALLSVRLLDYLAL